MPTAASKNSSIAQPAASANPSKAELWIGRVLYVLTILFLLFDIYGKFAKPVQVTDTFVRLGLPISTSVTIGVILSVCTVLYVIPRTAVLGAVLLTGYLGGAVSIQLRAGSSMFETIFPIPFAIVAWLAIYLRDCELRRILPFRR